MDESGSNPLVVMGFFCLRCGLPLLIMLGVSYLLKRMGVIAPAPKPPPDWDGDEEEQSVSGEGGLNHA
jgi:hypothetical protein